MKSAQIELRAQICAHLNQGKVNDFFATFSSLGHTISKWGFTSDKINKKFSQPESILKLFDAADAAGIAALVVFSGSIAGASFEMILSHESPQNISYGYTSGLSLVVTVSVEKLNDYISVMRSLALELHKVLDTDVLYISLNDPEVHSISEETLPHIYGSHIDMGLRQGLAVHWLTIFSAYVWNKLPAAASVQELPISDFMQLPQGSYLLQLSEHLSDVLSSSFYALRDRVADILDPHEEVVYRASKFPYPQGHSFAIKLLDCLP